MERLSFAASSAGRWLSCLASVREEQQHPRKTSRYADEGLAAHKLAETALLTHVNADAVTSVGASLPVDGKAHTVTDELLRHTQAYLDYVDMVASGCLDHDLYVEQSLDLSPWTQPGQKSVADAVLVDPIAGEAHVIDLKFGRGVEVVAQQNAQLGLYGLAVDRQLSALYGEFTTLHLHIAQPRRNHYDKWSLPADVLRDWGERTVRPTVNRILKNADNNLPYLPSEEACRFCRASGNCRAQADAALATVTEGFDNIVTPLHAAESNPLIEPRDVTRLLPQEVFASLNNVELIKTWCKALEAQGQHLLETRQAPADCGYKLVRAKTNRAWLDEKAADRALGRAGIKAPERYQPKQLISPAQAEKKLGKKHAIITGEKRQYIEKPEGAITIARQDDKREAVDADALVGFENTAESKS